MTTTAMEQARDIGNQANVISDLSSYTTFSARVIKSQVSNKSTICISLVYIYIVCFLFARLLQSQICLLSN